MAEIFPRNTPVLLGDTIGSLLGAIVDAQRASAEATTRYIEDVGFESGEGPSRVLRTTKIRFRKLDENQEPKEFEAEIPFLSLVPIPAIAVRKATIRFSFEVVATEKDPPPDPGAPAPGARFQPTGKMRLLGRAAPRPSTASTTTTNSAHLDISIELEAPDPAAGLSRLLDILELAAQEKKVP